jgi:hypothetical protein
MFPSPVVCGCSQPASIALEFHGRLASGVHAWAIPGETGRTGPGGAPPGSRHGRSRGRWSMRRGAGRRVPLPRFHAPVGGVGAGAHSSLTGTGTTTRRTPVTGSAPSYREGATEADVRARGRAPPCCCPATGRPGTVRVGVALIDGVQRGGDDEGHGDVRSDGEGPGRPDDRPERTGPRRRPARRAPGAAGSIGWQITAVNSGEKNSGTWTGGAETDGDDYRRWIA